MRTRRLLVLLILLAVLAPAASPRAGAPEAEVRATLRAYIQAMRRGELARLRPHLAGALYEREYRVLFEENAEYGRFLRRFYRGARSRLESVTVAPDGTTATAVITIKLRGGGTVPTTVDLAKEPGGAWKITGSSQ